jgi:hypothetical protein
LKSSLFLKSIVCTTLILLLSLLSLNRHSKAKIFNYHSEIWSDKAGYYIYLPAFFIYDFEADKFPDSVGIKTGNGFTIDKVDNKVTTKYTYGVALMQTPFFLIAHVLAKKIGLEANGFSIIYNRMIDIAAVFYTVFGLLVLYMFLINYTESKIAIITLIFIFLGSNLFYYSIFDTGMSHIYSFFLFSVFLFLSDKVLKANSNLMNAIFGLIIGLIISVRPVNIIFLPTFFIFNSIQLNNLKVLLKPFILMSIIIFVVLMPQFLYWKYLSGNFLFYTYTNEGFTNFLSPKILQLWFSPNNGLLLYNPIILLTLVGLIFLWEYRLKLSLNISLYFILISYIFSSWWSWSYGCSYGSRPFVEYYTILSLPLCYFSNYILNSNFKKYFLFIVVLFIGWNLKLIFSYDGCWYAGDWDWRLFLNLLISKTK